MGLLRKLTSISTGGVVDYRSAREQQGRALSANAKLVKEQAKMAKLEREAMEREARADRGQAEPLTLRAWLRNRREPRD